MSDSHRICQICHVAERYSSEKLFFAKFPLDEYRCKQWVKLVGNEDLIHLPIEKLHDQQYVCGKHFEKRDFTKSKTRLKKRAVPKLHLTLPPLPDALLEGFPLHVASTVRASTSKQMDIDISPTNIKPEAPPTIRKPDEESLVVNPTATTSKKMDIDTENQKRLKRKMTDDTTASTSKQMDIDVSPTNIKPEAPPTIRKPDEESLVVNPTATTSKKMDIDTENQKRLKRKMTDDTTATTSKKLDVDTENQRRLKSKMTDNKTELTPRKKKLMKELMKTKCTLRSLKKSATLIEKIESSVLKEIVLNASKNQDRKPRGRRWTIAFHYLAFPCFRVSNQLNQSIKKNI